MPLPEYVCVYEARDAVCANLLRLKLEFEGIDVHIDQEHLGPEVLGFFAAFLAPKLWVRREDEREAVRILAEVGREQAERRANEDQATSDDAEDVEGD